MTQIVNSGTGKSFNEIDLINNGFLSQFVEHERIQDISFFNGCKFQTSKFKPFRTSNSRALIIVSNTKLESQFSNKNLHPDEIKIGLKPGWRNL
jgi:hypothetical protein